uniref:Uncharacterized protein n=1 Tax=Arundo donax TaxID=35708 RepID=A0A0A9C7R3_ARUDO
MFPPHDTNQICNSLMVV